MFFLLFLVSSGSACELNEFKIDTKGARICQSPASCYDNKREIYRIDWTHGILPPICRRKANFVSIYYHETEEKFNPKETTNPRNAHIVKKFPAKDETPFIVPYGKIKNNFGKPL